MPAPFRPRPESLDFPELSWPGVRVRLTHRTSPHASREKLTSESAALVVSVEEVGGRTAIGSSKAVKVANFRREENISFVAEGDEIWEASEPIRLHRRVSILFEDTDETRVLRAHRSRYMFADAEILNCARRLAAESERGGRSGSLYGSAIAIALVDSVTETLGRASPRTERGLSARQLKKAQDFLVAHCAETIATADLASLIGLSESHFSRAFKVSTGWSPHRWLLKLRVEAAQALLVDPLKPLAEIAARTGFSDQSHLTRTFRAFVGEPPAAWRRRKLA